MSYKMFIRMKDGAGKVVSVKMLEAKKVNQLKRFFLAEFGKPRTFKSVIGSGFTVISMSDEEIPPHIVDGEEDDLYKRCTVAGLTITQTRYVGAKLKGRYAKEVADETCTALSTVNNTLQSAYKKLNVSSFKGAAKKLGLKHKKDFGRQLTLFEMVIQLFFLYQMEMLDSAFFQQFFEGIPQI